MGDYRSIIAAAFGLMIAGLVRADGLDEQPLLRESFDPALQTAVEKRVAALGLADAADRRDLCLTLVDISDPADPRVAAINGDHMMYAASLPKIGILLGAFVEIERGRLALDRQTANSLTRMIRISSNQDATKMLNRVGKHRVNQILQSERFRLYDPLVNGGLWVGKEYATGSAFQRDPLHNISHGATALQTARFYYMLETGQVVNPRLTRVMKEMLSRPGIEHKFVKGLADRDGVRIYRKSGTWRQWHADSAIVEAAGRYRYILTGLANDSRGGQWLANIAGSLHGLIVPTRLAATSP
ncbi:MAG: serine hydrolase [Gammaproteobacteria bacterium]|nr:serine hydrolase [Gammaproteobacteria bacterium]